MERNKETLSRREFFRWAEYFDWEQSQRDKQETYLARIISLLEKQVFKEPAEMGDCYCPPLSKEELRMAGYETDEKNGGMLDPASGWAMLGAVFGKKE